MTAGGFVIAGLTRNLTLAAAAALLGIGHRGTPLVIAGLTRNLTLAAAAALLGIGHRGTL